MEQITAEYKLLALQYHPDKNEGDKEAERKFQQLKVRFSLSLRNPKSKISDIFIYVLWTRIVLAILNWKSSIDAENG